MATQVLKFANQGGFPCIEVMNTSTTGTVTTFSFNEHPYRQSNRFYGGFWVKFPKAVTETSSNTVNFNTIGVGGSAVPVYTRDGEICTIAEFVSTDQTVHLFFYDRDSNRVQLIV